MLWALGMFLILGSLGAMLWDHIYINKKVRERLGKEFGDYVLNQAHESFYLQCVEEILTPGQQALTSFVVLLGSCSFGVGVAVLVIACIP